MGKRIVLVGVGHVFDISKQIEKVIDVIKPDAVALELDENRLSFLLNPHVDKGRPSLMYYILAKTQERIAKKYGVITGSEMIAAVKKARNENIGVLCIDKDAHQVFRMLWQSIPFSKKILFLFGGFSSFFISKKKVDDELHSFEENPSSYFEQIGSYFPEFKEILIDDRNSFMCIKILEAVKIYDTIIAFVGEGHISGLKNLLKKDIDEENMIIIHLKNLREGNWIGLLPERNPI